MTYYRRKATLRIITTAMQKLIPGAALAGMRVEITEDIGNNRSHSWSGSVMDLAERIHTALYGTADDAATAETQFSKLALLAKQTIEAAWLNGPSYDLAAQAAEALESAQLLQSPETAATVERLRASLQEIRHLHTDSPMGPCPVCVDADALARDEDPTVPWPCATAVLAGAKEIEPESASVPGFFRPGRIYTRHLPYRAPEDRPNFECIGVGRHPSKGVLRAFGFQQPGTGRPWASAAQRMEEWRDGWVEIGPARPDRLTQTFAPTQALREADQDEAKSARALIIYRASWDSIQLGLYTTEAAARTHCETHARRDLPTASFDWIEDEEDGVAELVADVDGEESVTGYSVTALEVASEYDEEADE
ncbi:hypothetical protein [Streptomyces sp. NPDC006193]|uniref:hypothetical protein n=1 Tax=Streptomyces sp. NPDC006193 TaxID=3155717 RepID=UPI0033BB2B63